MRGEEINLANIVNAIYNSGFGLRFLKPKIFLIGFNKCGTTSLHKFFHSQGLKSAHWMVKGKSLAAEVEEIDDVHSCRRFFSEWQVFSDFLFLSEDSFIEPLDKFPLWYSAFPDAYFILNDRNVDDWLRSRCYHRNGDFLRRYISYSGLEEERVIEQWRSKFLKHRSEVLSFFQGDDKFCHFKLGEDDIGKVVDFLRRDYRLNPAMFKKINSRRPSE